MYETPVVDFSNYQQTKKRRESFHRFGLYDQLSQHSLHSTTENDSLSEYLNESPHQSDYEFMDTVHRSPLLNSLVEKYLTDWFVDEANLVDEDDSSVFSLDLTLRAEKYGKYYIIIVNIVLIF